jgi:hypothetical protein
MKGYQFLRIAGVVLMILCSAGQLQAQSFLQKKISISTQQKSYGETLEMIAKNGGFHFSYNTALVPFDSLMSLDIQEQQIEKILQLLLPADVQYKVSGSHVILLPAPKKQQKSPAKKTPKPQEPLIYTIEGYIINTQNGKPVKRASVYEVGKQNAVLTNEEGYFKLKIDSEEDFSGISFSKEDYLDTVIVVKPDNKRLSIRLRPRPEPIASLKREEARTEIIEPVEKLKVVRFFVPEDHISQAQNLKITEKRKAQISFLPFLGSNHLLSGATENRLSLNVLAGYSGSIDGFEAGGVLNIVRTNVKGVQVAGTANIVGGNTRGVQLSGLFNTNLGSVTGLQASGISNLVGNTITGVQAAGLSNWLRGEMKGVQLAGLTNMTTQNVDGVQLAGLGNVTFIDVRMVQAAGLVNYGRNVGGMQAAGMLNFSSGRVGGAQLAGFANFSREGVGGLQAAGFGNITTGSVGGAQLAGYFNFATQTVEGIQASGFLNVGREVEKGQVSGFINIAYKRLRGLQLAGIFNFAPKVEGTQVGLINVADTVSGASIGLLSLVRKGYHEVEVSTNEVFYTNFMFKTGTQYFYNMIGYSFHPSDFEPRRAFTYGLGTYFKLMPFFDLHLNLQQYWVREPELIHIRRNHIYRFRTEVAFKLLERLSVVFGPSVNGNLLISWESLEDLGNSKVAPKSFYTYQQGTTQFKMWVGGNIGISADIF